MVIWQVLTPIRGLWGSPGHKQRLRHRYHWLHQKRCYLLLRSRRPIHNWKFRSEQSHPVYASAQAKRLWRDKQCSEQLFWAAEFQPDENQWASVSSLVEDDGGFGAGFLAWSEFEGGAGNSDEQTDRWEGVWLPRRCHLRVQWHDIQSLEAVLPSGSCDDSISTGPWWVSENWLLGEPTKSHSYLLDDLKRHGKRVTIASNPRVYRVCL